MIYASVYSLTVGLLMLVQWTIILIRRQVPAKDEGISGRGKREMLFHWAAESITAIALICSGISMLLGWQGARTLYMLATGMLIYTVINSSGWFAEQREWPMVGVFAVLLIGASIGLATGL